MSFAFQSWEVQLIYIAVFLFKKRSNKKPTDTTQADYAHKYETRKGIPEKRDQPGQPETQVQASPTG